MKKLFYSLAGLSFILYYLIYCASDLIQRKHVYLNQTTKCGRFPQEKDITIDNTIWQVLEISKGFVKILNAYLDTRQNKSVVRINVNSVNLTESDVFFCQFWFNDSSNPIVVEATETLLMWGMVIKMKFKTSV